MSTCYAKRGHRDAISQLNPCRSKVQGTIKEIAAGQVIHPRTYYEHVSSRISQAWGFYREITYRSPGYRDRPWIVRKFRSVWKPARMVSFSPYFTKSEAVGARRCGLERGRVNTYTDDLTMGPLSCSPVSARIRESRGGQAQTDGSHFRKPRDAIFHGT